MFDLFTRRPARVLGFVSALIALVTAFGFHLSATQVGGIMGIVTAGIGLFVESLVTPVASLPDESAV